MQEHQEPQKNKPHLDSNLGHNFKEEETDNTKEPSFQEIFDYEKISGHLFTRALWAMFLRLAFKVYVRMKIKGRFKGFYKKYPKLLIISNHTSHLDGPAILSAVPFSHWMDLYILAAQDYWFTNGFLRFFSKYFMNSIPINRRAGLGHFAQKQKQEQEQEQEQKQEQEQNRSTTGYGSFKNCLNLLNSLKRVWMIMFPEGTRSLDGSLKAFTKGVALLSQKTNTPILFLHFRGNHVLWGKDKNFPRPGKTCMHIGPVQAPADIHTIFNNYKKWVATIK